MSIGSVGSLRGLGPVEAPPSRNTMRHARSGSHDGESGSTAPIVPGDTGATAPSRPWAPWPPFQPVPRGPVEGRPDLQPMPVPSDRVGGERPVAGPMPPPQPEAPGGPVFAPDAQRPAGPVFQPDPAPVSARSFGPVFQPDAAPVPDAPLLATGRRR